MIIGNLLTNANEVLEPYVKDMKLSSSDKYVFTTYTHKYGRVIFCLSENSIRMICLGEYIHDKYMNKVYYVDALTDKAMGYECEIGVVEDTSNIAMIRAYEAQSVAVMVLTNLLTEILNYNVRYITDLHNDEKFLNDVLSLRASDGMGKYIKDDLVMMLSPQMLPGTKKNALDAKIYTSSVNTVYYVSEFITHKKFEVRTFMKFLYV